MRDFADDLTRERIRRNVGNPRGRVAYHRPPPGASRYGLIFADGELTGATQDDAGVIIPAPPAPPGTIPQGTIIGVAISVANATRRVGVTQTLPYPSVIRSLVLHGQGAISEAISYRVMIAQDDDTTAVAVPSGSDLIEFAGDVIGAEDVGIHASLSLTQLVVEPWRKVLTAGSRLKLKCHNVTGGTRTVALYADIDPIVQA